MKLLVSRAERQLRREIVTGLSLPLDPGLIGCGFHWESSGASVSTSADDLYYGQKVPLPHPLTPPPIFNSYVEVPQNMTVFRDRVFKNIIMIKYGCAGGP